MAILNAYIIVVTNAHARTFSKRDVYIVWSTLLIFICEAFWIEFLRFRKVLRVMLES